jgi:hypothetical protein
MNFGPSGSILLKDEVLILMHIEMQPEPERFYEKVQEKGEAFLASCPRPKGKEWDSHSYWRAIIPDLYNAYLGICVYTCIWTPFDTGWKTVEHFKPKDRYPQEAYQWNNYRFVCGTMNGRKGDYEDVLDPFKLQDGWFIMHFPSLQLKPGRQLKDEEKESVKKTIKRLKLNESACVRGRKDWLMPYLQKEYGFSFLEKRAPFLAHELRRQELIDPDHRMWAAFGK